MQSINQTSQIVNSSKNTSNIKGIPAGKETQYITPDTAQEIYRIVQEYTEDTEILNDVIYEIKELYKPQPIEINIFSEEYKKETEEIERIFTDIYIDEITNGLIETTITPESYFNFFNNLLCEYLNQQIFEEVKTTNNNTLIFPDELTAKTEIEYYITNDIKENLTETLQDVIYNLFIEDEEIEQEIRNFIYMQSYYED